MRKLLLGTSALIGATALVASASAAPELTISGGLDFQLWGGETQATGLKTSATQDRDRGKSNSGFEFGNASSLSEIRFHAEAETDEQLSYGAHFDYRYLGSSTDEAYLFVSGDFGTIHLGQDDGAVDALAKSADSIAPGGYLVNGWATSFAPEKNSTGDERKISYFSNDMSGFKFAISLTPSTATAKNATGNANLVAPLTAASDTARSAAHAAVGTSGDGETDAADAATEAREKAQGAQTALDNYIAPNGGTTERRTAVLAEYDGTNYIGGGATGQYEDVIEIGLSYTFGYDAGSATISYGVYAASANDPDNSTVANQREDLGEASFGFTASFGQWSVAGSLNSEGDSGLTKAQTNAGAEGRSYYDFGIAYDLGGGMNIGLSYAEAENKNAVAEGGASGDIVDTRTQSLTAIDFGFPILEGMSGFAGIAFSEYESDVANLSNLNSEGTTYVIGTSVSF